MVLSPLRAMYNICPHSDSNNLWPLIFTAFQPSLISLTERKGVHDGVTLLVNQAEPLYIFSCLALPQVLPTGMSAILPWRTHTAVIICPIPLL